MGDARFDHRSLFDWVEAAFCAVGLQVTHASSCARVLIAADLQGIDTHGVARIPAYVGLLQRGAVATNGGPEVVATDGATALVDAHNVMGQPAAEFAMGAAIDLARVHGTGWVGVRNSNHYGIAGYFARQAAEAGMLGVTGTNAGARVAPAGASRPFLGTNPIAVAAPTTEPPMFVLDMATSAVSTGRFEQAAREGTTIPEGWGVDRAGETTRDPEDLARGGWMLPLGSFPHLSDHKGSGLALAIEVLTALLVGGPYGPNVHSLVFADSSEPPGVSHFFCALDPGRFGRADDFAERVTEMLAELRSLPSTDPANPVMSPGEPEWRIEQDRSRHGIPLIDPVIASLASLGEAVGVPFPEAREHGTEGSG